MDQKITKTLFNGMTKIERIIYLLSPFLILIPFIFWLYRYLNIDFWYDEIFTLTNYVFCPIKKTLTDYSFPNNHILANLLNNIYLRLLGIRDINQLLDTPYKIRLLQLLYTAVSLFYIYRIGKKFFNDLIALLTLSIFTTTVTYYNFTLQVRGFSLSIMLTTILLYHLLKYSLIPKISSALVIIFSAAILLYTIPSNLYFLLGISGYYLLSILIGRRRKRFKDRKGKRDKGKEFVSQERLMLFLPLKTYISLLFFLFFGVIISVLLYSPILKDVISNRFVQSYGLFYFPTLSFGMPFTFTHFLSGRYIFLPLIIIGLFSFYRDRTKHFGFLIFLILAPFIFSFIRGDRPPLRIFVILIPVFALFISLLAEYGLVFISQRFVLKFSFLLLGLIIYNQITFAFQLRHIERKLVMDIEEGVKSQDLNYNYYQAHYYPLRLLSEFKRIYDAKPHTVFLLEYDKAALPVYLERFAIPWRHFQAHSDLISAIEKEGRVYVITAFPNNLIRTFAYLPNFIPKRINQDLDFHNIFEITRKR